MRKVDAVSDTGPNDKRILAGISARAFEHPLDRTALAGLQKVPGLDWVIRKFISTIGERRLRLLFLASAVRVDAEQLPQIRDIYAEACRVLDIDHPPELFVAQKFFVNAAAIGVDKPFIMVTSAMLEMMDEEELQCVLGHELGHVMCGHALYTTMLMLMVNLWYLFLGIPGGIYALIAIRMALLEWSRKAELSSDRAGLLVSQKPEVSYRVDMKLAGGGRADQMSLESFFAQAAEYDAAGDLLDGVLKLALIMEQSHPFPVLRVAELRRWVDSGDYNEILSGTYVRRDREKKSAWLADVKATAADYRESFGATQDPLFSTLRDLGGGAAATGTEIADFIRKMLGFAPPDDRDDSSG